ncbi:MAG: zinc ribbon domain-containing protein [Lachnospiraceae bacterium]|nr:zinc ribbon domain-containing protein [Lachnospiraceae bacterium]
MDIIEKIGDTIVNVGKDVSQKAKEASSAAKLRLSIRAKEEFIKEQYMELGKLYYERYKKAGREDLPRFEQIDEAFEEIAQMEQQLMELKKVRKCPECGSEAAETAEFCSVCGAKLSVKEEVVFEEEEADEENTED